MNPRLKILIVDDDQRMTRTLADIITLVGHEPAQASSAKSALEMIAKEHFDCVLTDVRMPEMDGVAFHHVLHQSHPGIPVVLMTAYAADDLIRQGLDEGVIGVLDKPLDITQLLGFFSSLAQQRAIAIVDDDPAFCETLGDILRGRGFLVKKVTDPHADILPIAADAQVLLVDMKLNSITGLDVLKMIKEKYPDLPVLIVTAYRHDMVGSILAAVENSAYACLYKPVEIPHLIQTLRGIQLDRLRAVMAQG